MVYRKITRVKQPGAFVSKRHEPANVVKKRGPEIIFIATRCGGETVMYSVSIRNPKRLTTILRTPGAACFDSPVM